MLKNSIALLNDAPHPALRIVNCEDLTPILFVFKICNLLLLRINFDSIFPFQLLIVALDVVSATIHGDAFAVNVANKPLAERPVGLYVFVMFYFLATTQ